MRYKFRGSKPCYTLTVSSFGSADNEAHKRAPDWWIMRFGAHMSIGGGVYKAFGRGEKLGCETIQIFTKNANQWKAKPLTKQDVTRFAEEERRTGIQPVLAHDSYLINIASPDSNLRQRSLGALHEEMERAERLGVPYLVLHPGAHRGAGEEAGLRRIAENINLLHTRTPSFKLMLLLETTAGQNTVLGYRFEQLREILGRIEQNNRVGICLDTAHIFAAGYDLRRRRAFDATLEDFEKVLGLHKLKAVHVNDSKKPLGSRVDRHEHIGKGFLGIEAFRLLVNEPRLSQLPMILETPKEPGADAENLRVLRGLVRSRVRGKL